MRFFLGTPHPHWLSRQDVPLFVSREPLVAYQTPPKAIGPWALDSGGFTELSLYGRWRVGSGQFLYQVRDLSRRVGNMQWAAVQDWMCEEYVCASVGLQQEELKPDPAKVDAERSRLLRKRKGKPLTAAQERDCLVKGCLPLSDHYWARRVRIHQAATIGSYQVCKDNLPEIPWVPVLQGFRHDDYLRHVEHYRLEGIGLRKLPLVGLGSVCRRQGMGMVEALIRELHGMGIRLHAFGFKLEGLRKCARYLVSADSMAWSFDARRSAPLPDCRGKHQKCNNCPTYALWWREKALRAAAQSEECEQGLLFTEATS